MFPAPNVRNVYVDQAAGVRYVVLAYRPMNALELVTSIRIWLSGLKRRQRPKRGEELEITTIVGLRD